MPTSEMNGASDFRKTSGSRSFFARRDGRSNSVRVCADRGHVTVYVHSSGGAMASSRVVNLGQVPDEVLNLMAADEGGGALADALVEMGLDDGAADVIRGW